MGAHSIRNDAPGPPRISFSVLCRAGRLTIHMENLHRHRSRHRRGLRGHPKVVLVLPRWFLRVIIIVRNQI